MMHIADAIIVEVDFDQKLDRCLAKKMIPYLHKHTSQTKISKVVMTHDIIREMRRNKIGNIGTLQAIARELPNFEYGPLKLNCMSAAYLIDNNQS